MRTPEADVKRKIPVVLLAAEEQEAEVCTLCHYTSFEDVPDRGKRLHIKTQLRGMLKTTYSKDGQRGSYCMLGINLKRAL